MWKRLCSLFNAVFTFARRPKPPPPPPAPAPKAPPAAPPRLPRLPVGRPRQEPEHDVLPMTKGMAQQLGLSEEQKRKVLGWLQSGGQVYLLMVNRQFPPKAIQLADLTVQLDINQLELTFGGDRAFEFRPQLERTRFDCFIVFVIGQLA